MRRSPWLRWGRNATLLALTALSVFLTGGGYVDSSIAFLMGTETAIPQLNATNGVELAVALLSILLAHEMGHYVACRHYHVEATLPFLIPAPILNPLAGTFGAVIRIKSPFPHRRALFDIGIAGPLAGFLVCLPVLVLGILQIQFVPEASSNAREALGAPLLFQWALDGLRRDAPAGTTALMGPLGRAAWFGLLVTALNLIPIGQLDGGHVTYALFGSRALFLSRVVWWLCILMILFIGPTWILWSILVRFLGFRHPPTLDDSAPLGRARAVVALLGLGVFVVCFLPNPILLSWRDALHSLGLQWLT